MTTNTRHHHKTERQNVMPGDDSVIPYGRQSISDEDIDAVVRVLRSDWLTQGPEVPAFEKEIHDYCGASHAVAVNSGTSALHLACLALGLGPGDWLWTSPITFVASANCARYCGALVDFVDLDPETHNMDPSALSAKLELAEKCDRLPKVVMPVHFAGQPCDLDAIAELAQQYGFQIIEDAAHALGARFKGERVGSGRYSAITVFSLHPVKNITTAEGGVAVTNDPKLAATMRRLRSHGTTRNPDEMIGDSQGPWYYEQSALGYNYRMTDVQAALGRSQLARLDEFVHRRTQLAERYTAALSGLPIRTPVIKSDTFSAWHLYVISLELKQRGIDRRSVFDALRQAGILVNVHYIPVHTQPYYKALGFHEGMFPISEDYYSRALTLPLYPSLTKSDQDKVIETLTQALA